MESLAPPLERRRAGARSGRRRAGPAAAPSACCSAACSASSSPASTPPRPGCSRPRASTSSPRAARAAAARCRRTTGGRTRRRRFARRPDRRASTRAGVDFVVVNSAGCGSSMKEYADLLADDPTTPSAHGRSTAKVRDVSELLAEVGPGGAAAPAAGHRRLPRRLPPRRTPRASAASPASCCAASRAGAARDRRVRPVLRLRRDLQPPQPRARARARGPQGRQRAAHRRASCWSPPTPAA